MANTEDIKKLEQEQIQAEKDAATAQNQLVEKQKVYSEILEKLTKSGQFTIKDGQDLSKTVELLNKVLQERVKQEQLTKRIINEATKNDKKLADIKLQEVELKKKQIEESKKGFWNQIKTGGSDTIDWNLDRRINGLNSLLSGNFKYGALQIAQSFKIGRNFINHPLVMFATAAAKLGFALNDFSTKTDRLANRIAGGSLVAPDAKNRKWQMSYEDTVMAMMYGQSKKDFYDYKIGSFGSLAKERLSRDPRFTQVWSQGRSAMQDLGANPDIINTFLQQQLAIGRSTNSMEKFNYRLIKSIQGLDLLSSSQFTQAIADLNKTFLANNINGLANAESLKRFQDQLNKGTLTIADFTRGLTSRREASTSTLAGIGALMAERGLGGKELQEAYNSGDMVRVAGIMRRGGNNISRGVEQLQTQYGREIADQLGTSDVREVLAMLSESSLGQLGPNLKNLEVENILLRGGSLTVSIDGKDTTLDKIIKDKSGKEITEEEDLKNIDRELVNSTVDNTNALKSLTNLLQLGGLWGMKEIEPYRETLTNASGYLNPISGPLKAGKFIAEIIIGNPNQTK